MAKTTHAIQAIQNAFWQAASLGAPATHYVGLLCIPNATGSVWAASHTYSLGAYTIPSTFSSIAGEQGKIFKCTAAGTSGSTEPTWPTSEGGTVADGTVTWTECTLLFQAGTFTSLEPSGNGYARVAVTANGTNFANATNAEPCLTENSTAIAFATPTADWGLAVGWIDCDALTAGNVWEWATMTSALDCPSGSNPSFGANALQSYMSALLTA